MKLICEYPSERSIPNIFICIFVPFFCALPSFHQIIPLFTCFVKTDLCPLRFSLSNALISSLVKGWPQRHTLQQQYKDRLFRFSDMHATDPGLFLNTELCNAVKFSLSLGSFLSFSPSRAHHTPNRFVFDAEVLWGSSGRNYLMNSFLLKLRGRNISRKFYQYHENDSIIQQATVVLSLKRPRQSKPGMVLSPGLKITDHQRYFYLSSFIPLWLQLFDTINNPCNVMFHAQNI